MQKNRTISDSFFQVASAEGLWCCSYKCNSTQEAGLTPTDSVFRTGEVFYQEPKTHSGLDHSSAYKRRHVNEKRELRTTVNPGVGLLHGSFLCPREGPNSFLPWPLKFCTACLPLYGRRDCMG